MYPVMALAFAVLTYAAASLLEASGLLAVYVMAIVLGNSDLTYWGVPEPAFLPILYTRKDAVILGRAKGSSTNCTGNLSTAG